MDLHCFEVNDTTTVDFGGFGNDGDLRGGAIEGLCRVKEGPVASCG